MRSVRLALALLLGGLLLFMTGCQREQASDEESPYIAPLHMNTEFAFCDELPDGQGARVKVIILLGQSNASGCSLVNYLAEGVSEETFACYESGFDNVLINYCIDDGRFTSEGEFVPVDLSCGCGNGFFGPEVGLAERLSAAFPEETVMILKYTMSGYSINDHWLSDRARGSIYDACLIFLTTYLQSLTDANYQPEIGAILWMQGESDTTDAKGARYEDNQAALMAYLREDLAPWARERGIYWIDAGISNSPYCEPAYPAVNAAKEALSERSPLNLYFSTIDAGLTTLYEPQGNPDLGHYDALCELALGHMFGDAVVGIYGN